MISSQPCARKMSLNGTFFHTMGDGNIHMISSLGAKKEVWEKLITLVLQHQHLKGGDQKMKFKSQNMHFSPAYCVFVYYNNVRIETLNSHVWN